MIFNHNHSLAYRGLLLLLFTSTLAIIIYTVFAAYHFASNAMLGMDEANFVIISTLNILDASTFQELIDGLFSSHGQHLLLGMQLINLAVYSITGNLDRPLMDAIGVAILALASFPLIRNIKVPADEKILFFAIAFPIILSPTHNTCIVNASCTGNHYLGIALCLLSLDQFCKSQKKLIHFLLAEALMFLAIFSLPAAFMILPISFAIIYYNGRQSGNYHQLYSHAVISAFLLMGHYWLSYPFTIFSVDTSGQPVSMTLLLEIGFSFLITFLLIMGSMFYWLKDLGHPIIVALIGMVHLGLCIYVLVRFRQLWQHENHRFHILSTILFLSMVIVISYGRYQSFGSSRYSVYTDVLLVSLLISIFHLITSTRTISHQLRIRILLISAGLSLGHYLVAHHYHQGYLDDLALKNEICRDSWRRQSRACGVMIPHDEASELIRHAIERGIYRVDR